MTRPRARTLVRRSVIAAITMVPASIVALQACDATNAIVGGSCASGHTDCQGMCVEVATDPDNCGLCGHRCASGVCVSGLCPERADAAVDARHDGSRDAEPRDAARGDGTLRDAPQDSAVPDARPDGHDGALRDAMPGEAAQVDGAAGDGASAEATTKDASPVDSAAADRCAPPYTTTSDCGACGAACATGEVCSPSPDGGAYGCAPLCTLPLTDCDGTCVDLTSDPLNCGSCDNVCPSGICVSSACAGMALGDIVIIGHDYASSNVRVSEGAILANAVFLPPTNPLRILSFEQYAIASQVTNAKAVLEKAALSSGRQIQFTVLDDYTLVPASLASSSYDVFFVYDQGNAVAGTLGGVGSTWQASVEQFVELGGDVVVLDGASGPNPQMTDLLTSAALLDTSAEVRVTPGTQLFVVASGDAVGNFVVSPYAAQADTVWFQTSATSGGNVTYVVDDGSDAASAPVVIHRVP